MNAPLRRRYGYALRPILLQPGERLGAAAVLAARYRGKDIGDRSTLVHAVVIDTDGYVVRAICKRVPDDGLADATTEYDVTCPECIRRTPAVRLP